MGNANQFFMLSPTWITDHTLDHEYKQYMVLNYVQQVDSGFANCHIQPHLKQLDEHIQHINDLDAAHQQMSDQLKSDLKGVDLANGQLIYELPSMQAWEELQAIMDFALQHFGPLSKQGNQLWQNLLKQVQMQQVGLVPLYQDEGYLLLHPTGSEFTRAYYYQLKKVHTPDQTHPRFETEFVKDYQVDLGQDYSKIKLTLTEEYDLPNPAVFALKSDLELPFDQTLLPMALQILGKYVA